MGRGGTARVALRYTPERDGVIAFNDEQTVLGVTIYNPTNTCSEIRGG
jgi:hypothetical protein